MLSFFPRGVLDEILNLMESVSEEFPSYSCPGDLLFALIDQVSIFMKINILTKFCEVCITTVPCTVV